MISILNSSMERLAIIKDSYDPWRFEEINGENTLSFNSILTEKVANYVNENNIVEIDDDYFDIAYYSKDMNEDGTATMDVECEHISYRLNDPMYNMDYFTETGTPNHILSRILTGTGFTLGTVEFAGNITYSAQEKKSRRQLLMEFVTLLGGEIDFKKFTVSILKRRGSTDLKIFTKGKNIKIISKVYNGREDTSVIAYTCTPIVLPSKEIGLGDDILLIQPELGIEDTLRVVRRGFNPDDNMLAEIEIANYINGLEDQLYRIETTTVVKEKLYNGTRIGPEEGFVAERSDGKARTIMNATEGISIYSDVGQGLERNFYVDLEGRIQARGLDISGDATFQGDISASTINIGNGMFTVDIDGNMEAYSGYFKGTIEASNIIGGSITSNTNIDVNENVSIGNHLYIGGGTSIWETKGIIIEHGNEFASLEVDGNGDMELFSRGNMLLSSFDDIKIDASSDLVLNGFDVEIAGRYIEIGSSYSTILSGSTYIWDDSTYDNHIATIGDLDLILGLL